MGIAITNLSDAVQFQFNADRLRRIAHGQILSANAHREIGTKTWKITIVCADGSRFTFKYKDLTTPAAVASPTTADVNQVTNLILVYNSGGGNKDIFYATAAQTTFTTTFVTGSNVDVYINGVLQSSGYSWTSGTTTVTFTTVFGGGEEVIIANR